MKPTNSLGGSLIAAFVMVMCAAALSALFRLEIPIGNRDAAMLAIGIVFGWGGHVVGKYFGTTEGHTPNGKPHDPFHTVEEQPK